jgi:hypothetical protein
VPAVTDAGHEPDGKSDPTALTTDALRREIEHLKELTAEKFAGVVQQFTVIERQRVEQKVDSKREIDAALTAQKESAAKSEASIVKLLDENAKNFSTSISALTTQVDDLKLKQRGAEQEHVGSSDAKTGLYAMAGFIVTLVVIGGFVASVLAGKG